MIKNFYFFGTSYSSGGGLGFKYNNKKYLELKNKAYPNKPNWDNYRYSISGRLEQLFQLHKVKYNRVKNLSKPGYGTERTLREINNLIYDNTFKSDESILLIELTDNMFRRDMYFNPLSDFIICNHNKTIIDDTIGNKFISVKEFMKDSKDITDTIDEHFETLKKYYQLTHNFEVALNKNINQVLSLICMLDKLQINYLFTSGPYFIPKFKLDKIGFDNTNVIIDDISTFISDNKISIRDESNGIVYDNHHAGYLGTDYITKTIFNKLSDFNFIDSNRINLPNIQKFI